MLNQISLNILEGLDRRFGTAFSNVLQAATDAFEDFRFLGFFVPAKSPDGFSDRLVPRRESFDSNFLLDEPLKIRAKLGVHKDSLIRDKLRTEICFCRAVH
jgi:hypothetical protein